MCTSKIVFVKSSVEVPCVESPVWTYSGILLCEGGDIELIEVLSAHKIQNFRTKNEKCKLLNSTAITRGYAGRDLQEGTSDGSFFSKSSFKIQSMVKDLLLVLVKKKRKMELKLS